MEQLTNLNIAPVNIEAAEIVNKAQFIAAINASNERYAGQVITDKAEAKRDRAEINRILKQVDDARKRIKKSYEIPYKAFETELKGIIAPLQTTAEEIDSQIKLMEYEERAKRRKDVERIYADIPTDIPLPDIWDDKWLAPAVSLKKIKEELMNAVIERTAAMKAQSPFVKTSEYNPRNEYVFTETGTLVIGKPDTYHLTVSCTLGQYDSLCRYMDNNNIFYLEG